MSRIIAITGKGGVGKTSIAGLIVARLIARGRRPVLAVDADPNSCLDIALGVRAVSSIGRAREEARLIASKGMGAGISKQDLLELKIAESLVEAEDFDLIAMGRPEGPGCYCYANNVLKNALGEIVSNYPFTVLDNEAGLENLSRRIVKAVHALVIVTDPSRPGLETAVRLHELAREMEISYDRLVLIVNRLRRDELPALVFDLKERIRADLVLGLPDDLELAEFGEEGKSLFELSGANIVAARVDELLDLLVV